MNPISFSCSHISKTLKVLYVADKHTTRKIILGHVFQHAKTWQRYLPNAYNLEERGDLGARIFGCSSFRIF